MDLKFVNIIILIFILVISIGVVSAHDNATDDLNMDDSEITQDEILSDENQAGTLVDLQNEIEAATDSIEINRDYEYNYETDKVIIRILINKPSFVINGNNHVIDAKNSMGLFVAQNGINLTINNLILKNAYDENYTGLIFINSYVTTNNVTFENCCGYYGTVVCGAATYISNNDKFIDSTGPLGVITLQNSRLLMNNALLKSNKELNNGFIYSQYPSEIYVTNSTFANTTSNYTAAIKGDIKTVVKNCRFYNLHSHLTAGAIGLKTDVVAEIDNCLFENVSSQKNGGAVYIDVLGYGGTSGGVIVNNTMFKRCSSEFGGAYVQLGGILNMNNCTFEENNATYGGGAVYNSGITRFILSNSTFTSNRVTASDETMECNGGAIYNDNGNFEIRKCTFNNNYAVDGGAIYAYYNALSISNTSFSGNNLNAVYCVFNRKEVVLENVTNETDIFSLNNTQYLTGFEGEGMEYSVLDNSINVKELPTRFDLRDWKWVTPVKNQGNTGACWVFGTTGAIESAILKNIGIAYEISENNIFNNALAYSIYGHNNLFEPGGPFDATGYVLNWFGIIPTEYDVYDELGKISPVIDTEKKIHVQDCIFLYPQSTLQAQVEQFKWALIKYGGINVFYHAEQGNNWINEKTAAQYNNHNATLTHAVTLIGWDDNYSRFNFNPKNIPPGDGAWIVKNSWGTQAGDNGYYYISYYDVSFGTTVVSTAYCLENNDTYNKNYQYDFSGFSHFITANDPNDNVTYANIYSAIEDDLIAAVGTYFHRENVSYTVEIYVNGELKHTQSGLSPFAGFHTIKLDKYIYIKEGDEFAAVVTADAMPYMSNSRLFISPQCSFLKKDGEIIDLETEKVAACLKVYTIDETRIKKQNVTIEIATIVNTTYGGDVEIVVVVKDSKSTVDEGSININFNNESYDAELKDGIARFTISNLNAGTYNAKINFEEDIYYNAASINVTFSVNPALVDFEVNVSDVYYGNAVKFQAFITSYGKIINSGELLFTINDKNYTSEVDNGTATLEISNLDVGTYTAKITFNGGDNYYSQAKSVAFNVLKEKNAIIIALDSSFVINYGGAYSITLKDGDGNVVSGENLIFTLNGKKIGSAITDANGVATIKLTANILKAAKAGTHSLVIKLDKNNYNCPTKTVKITIKKEATKLIAKKKTFKKSKKIKKYTITLKNSKGKAIAKAKVTLKIKKKTYKATTNAKGKATFKIKKLNKKGNYRTTITYKGDNNYNKITKTVKIIIK